MFRAFLFLMISAVLLSAAAVVIDQPVRPTPLVRTLTPSSAQAGSELTAAGQNLGKGFVGAVYLTSGNNQFEAKITNQTATSIQFVVPADVKPGRFGLMVLTKGDIPSYIEEPVYVTIE